MQSLAPPQVAQTATPSAAPDPRKWDEVRLWRRGKRAELIERRVAILQRDRAAIAAHIVALLMDRLRDRLADGIVGFYWPFKAEIDLRPLLRQLVADGAGAALPVVVEKNRPVEFWAWHPGARMSRGIWDIPVPAERVPVSPTTLLVPLLGFDAEGYRLGYGGGYYDRTLAAAALRPFTIGVGYELGRLPTIFPQPHDIPMDVIVTEAGVVGYDRATAAPARVNLAATSAMEAVS